jgi:uncharacterized membrane protein YdjX (TVP38/TMEM64 family)
MHLTTPDIHREPETPIRPITDVTVTARPSLLRRTVAWLTRPVAPASWDRLLWASGVVSLLGALTISFAPGISDLAVFFSLSLLINGPYGSLLPTAYEPIVIVFARLHNPLLIGVLGATAATLVEYINYRVFHVALHSRVARGLRNSRMAARVLRWFRAQPFLTIVACAIAPIPFWIARSASALASYPIARHVTASGIGRFIRLTFYGYVGTVLKLSNGTILLLGAVVTLVLLALILHRARQAPRLQAEAIETA